jgi:hypothetical protein
MLEKLVMTGGVRLLRVYAGGFFLANTVAITVVTFMLCLLVARRPSKTGPRAATAAPRTLDPVLTARWTLSSDPYNTAMIVSHAVTLCMLLATIMLNFPTEGTADAWLTPGRLSVMLALLQLPFWIYLIWVSFRNLKAVRPPPPRRPRAVRAVRAATAPARADAPGSSARRYLGRRLSQPARDCLLAQMYAQSKQEAKAEEAQRLKMHHRHDELGLGAAPTPSLTELHMLCNRG